MLLLLLLAVRRLRRKLGGNSSSHNAFRHNTDPISTSKTANRATDLAIESLWCFLNQYIRILEYSIAFLDTTKSQWRRKERKRNKKRLAN